MSRRGASAAEDGTLVIHTNRTSTDLIAEIGGDAKRTIGRTFMARQLENVFETIRASLGR